MNHILTLVHTAVRTHACILSMHNVLYTQTASKQEGYLIEVVSSTENASYHLTRMYQSVYQCYTEN